MRSPQAEAAGKSLQRAVMHALEDLTPQAVIFDVVSAVKAREKDPGWRPGSHTPSEAIAAGRAAVRALEPPTVMAGQTSKVHMPRWFVVGWSRPVDRMFVVYLGPWRFARRS